MIPSRIDHFGLNVSNLDESIAFYARLFGFSVIERGDDPKQAFVGADGIALGLMEVSGYDYRAYTMAHIAFPCDEASFPAVVSMVGAMGLEIVSGPKPQRDGETILFRDPSGNILEVCYPSLDERKAASMSQETSKPTLRALAADLWDAEFQKSKFGLHLRMRMTVIRLPSGGLWLHSPVPIDDDLARQLANLGPVEHIVAPNCFHHLHAAAAKARYPVAKLWAAPGLPEKRKDIHFDAILSEKNPEWSGTVESVFIPGMPKFNEFVFFHRPSRSLICSDFVFNIQEEPSDVTRVFWRLFGVWRKLGQNRFWRWNVKNPSATRDAVEKVLAWDFERIVMAHGDVVEIDPSRLRHVLI